MMKLIPRVIAGMYSLFLLVSCASINPVFPEFGGKKSESIFEISRMGSRHAQFIFHSSKEGAGTEPANQVIEVQAEPNEDIRRAVVRKMVEIIRQYHQEDFNWNSYRLGTIVVLSARMEDIKGLEDFLMREFFMNDPDFPEFGEVISDLSFQITRMGPRHAQFILRSSKERAGKGPINQVIEVKAEPNEEIRYAVVRKMIRIIRQYQQEDFDWRSYRLGVKVALSSRMEDSKGLEEFLMRDFFKNDRVVHVNPKQMSDLRERGIGGRVIADGEITSEGTVRELVITESPDPALETIVIEAILRSRFEPFLTKKGHPVPERYRQAFEFEKKGIDRKAARYTFPKNTEHLPIAFQYDMPPVVRVVTPVVYPLNLLRNNISGSATVAVVLDPDGNVQEVHIVKATHPEFGLSTRGMMQSWEFEPATKNGLRTWSIFIQEQKFNSYGTDEEITESGKNILRKLKNHGSDSHAISALDSLPEALYKPNPFYPSHLSKKGVKDHVVVEFFIDEEGKVQLPHIIKAKNDELAWIAVTAVSRWHFAPPLRHGQPVVTRAQLPITFDSSQEVKAD